MPKRQFLFSAVFGFKNPTKEIFSELEEINAKDLIFPRSFQRAREAPEESPGGPTPQGGAAKGAPPMTFARQQVEDGDLEHKDWVPDHVDPADQADDDENPDAADQAAQGHDDPPPSPQPHEEEPEADVPNSLAPIRAVPLAARPPATSASSTAVPRGRKRPTERTTAQLEAKVKKQRWAGPKAGRHQVFQGRWLQPGLREFAASPQRREPTRNLRRAAHATDHPAACYGGGSFQPHLRCASSSGSRGEPARRAGQPSIDDMFPRRSRLIDPAAGAGRAAPSAGAGGAAPNVVILDGSPDTVPLPPESTIPTGPAGPAVPPPASEPTREDPERLADADARALVKAKGPAQAPEGPAQPLINLHVSPAASLLNVVSASDSSLGSAGTMEKEWCRADTGEVTSREGIRGRASMEMFFSSFRAYAKAAATETENRLAWLEMASKAVEDKRTALYNRLVASYHKAKIERADMARELEAAKGKAESEKAVQAAAAKVKETEGELARLRRLEANHLTELDSLKRVEQEKVADLSKRLEEVERQRMEVRKEVASKSNELTATTKRWVEEISSLDRGLAGKS
ncbi:hypothetical protein QYE76_045408 [Lolium multiflorum]|uniref:Uncharacterized protein n=1 Tax=Lolium multiflorum TaxID=4521 RepID=A0AAD8TKC7_LOLMU|nr:hypothetical protein QYE76_045408 [Lolium multiflorum]